MKFQHLKPIFSLFFTICLISANSIFAQEDKNVVNTAEYLISDYYNTDFKPFNKGRWGMKLAVALSEQDLENTNRGFDNVIIGNDLNWDLDVSAGYYFAKYFMVGLTFGYEQSVFTGDIRGTFNSIVATSLRSETFSFTPFLRTSIPLIKNNRLSIFNDIGMIFSFGTLDESRDSNLSGLTTKTGDTFGFGIGLTPGITYFAIQNFALEVGLNLIGYSYQVEKTQVDNDPVSKKAKNDISFQINLLSLNMGISYIFGAKK